MWYFLIIVFAPIQSLTMSSNDSRFILDYSKLYDEIITNSDSTTSNRANSKNGQLDSTETTDTLLFIKTNQSKKINKNVSSTSNKYVTTEEKNTDYTQLSQSDPLSTFMNDSNVSLCDIFAYIICFIHISISFIN